jgi:hypothetical protein
MPTPTLQQRLVNALIATGRGTIIPSRSRKYVTLKRPDGSFFYVGKAGRCASATPSSTAWQRPTTSSDACLRKPSNSFH